MTTSSNRDSLLQSNMTEITQGTMVRDAKVAYDLLLVKLMRLEPSAEEWCECHSQLNEARNALVAYQAKYEQALAKQQQPTKVEPEPTTADESMPTTREAMMEEIAKVQAQVRAKTKPQAKAEENARIAMANKGKSAEEKAEALDVPVATVRKVEKAKAKAQAKPETTNIDDMNSAAMKLLAKELGVDFTNVKFNSKTQREGFRATLKQAVLNHEAKVWEGLSPSRQAQLTKMASIPNHRLHQGSVFLKY